MKIFLIVLALMFTHGLAWLFGWLMADVWASDRVNRAWINKYEWKRMTRIGGAGAWLKTKED